MINKKIVVTGGSGMVGRCLKDILPDAVYLSSKDYDLTDPTQVINMYLDFKPHVVIHLAAKVGGIIDNINKPAEYYDDNILMNTNLIKYSRMPSHKVEKFISILSTCIYPDKVESYPMTEEMLRLGPPTKTNFSYGYAKRSMAVQIDAYNQQYETNYNYLTPCNLYGEYDKYGDNSHFIGALIKKIILAKRNGDKHIQLFGTGKPLRQFMYAKDFANIIKKHIFEDMNDNYNVAVEDNLSIREMANIALNACEAKHLELKFDDTKPDGQFRKDVSIERFKQIYSDYVFTNLHNGIEQTYKYLMKNNIIT